MNPFPKAFGFNRLADNLRVAPSRLSVDRTITLIRPLAETTLFDRPREPVVKSLRKGPKGLGLGREVWVVFETVSYPEKEWGGMDGVQKRYLAVRSDVSTSSGSMLALPRPPARRRTGRPLDASISYPPLTPASNTMGKTVDDIPNLPPGAGYNLSNLSNLSNPNPSVSLPKKGKDDSRRERDRPSFGLPHDPHPFPNSKNVDRQEDKVREKTDEPLLSVPNGLGQQPKRDGDSKNEEGEDDIISVYEYGDSEKSDQGKGTSTGRRANENGDNEEDVERVVIDSESDDGRNVGEGEGRSDNGRGRESEKESISAALLNNHPSQDEAADEGEEKRERAVEREGDRALTTKESSKKKRKQRRKNRHEHRHRSFAHSSKEKKRHNKEDGWFEVAFKGLPFGPDVPGVSQNIYYSSTRRAELRSSGS